MPVIEYRLVRRRDVEAEAAQAPAASPADLPAAASIPRRGKMTQGVINKAIPCFQDVAQDDVCGIVAYDGEEPVARIALSYTQLLVDGQLHKGIVGSGFFVREDYRSKAVGLSILLKVLGLGLPYIEASVSGPMHKILERFPKFKLVDTSPIFQVAVDRAGILQMAKWDLYKQGHPPGGFFQDKFLKAGILVMSWRQRLRVVRSRGPGVLVIARDAALAHCLAHLNKPLSRVQLPWTVAGLRRALSESNPNHAAWLVRSGDARLWLVSIYRRERVLGYDNSGQPRLLREAHLNEIYPPPDNPSQARQLFAFALERAGHMSAQVMHIHATTRAILAACELLGLGSRSRKSIFIAPAAGDADLQATLGTAQYWLCRAWSEDEFEESFGADASPDTASCVPAARSVP